LLLFSYTKGVCVSKYMQSIEIIINAQNKVKILVLIKCAFIDFHIMERVLFWLLVSGE